MAAATWETLKQYGLIGRVRSIAYCTDTCNKLHYAKIIAIVMDNATNNDTLMAAIKRRSNEAGVYFSARDSWLRCMPHTVHLAAIKVCCIIPSIYLNLK
jgi:hypothetical protein